MKKDVWLLTGVLRAVCAHKVACFGVAYVRYHTSGPSAAPTPGSGIWGRHKTARADALSHLAAHAASGEAAGK